VADVLDEPLQDAPGREKLDLSGTDSTLTTLNMPTSIY
jgi:hypothetical protein